MMKMTKEKMAGPVKVDKHRGLVPPLPDGKEHGLPHLQVEYEISQNAPCKKNKGELEVLQGFLGPAGGQDDSLKSFLRLFKSHSHTLTSLNFLLNLLPFYIPMIVHELCWVFQMNKVHYMGLWEYICF